MKIIKIICAAILYTSALCCSYSYGEIDVKKSVVKIYTVYNRYDYYNPWQMEGQKTNYGSGCIIKGNRVLTNAHMVSDATFIQVKRARGIKRYIANVEYVGHECDLAVLTVPDETFFEDTESLEIGDLVSVQDRITAYGFPMGGDDLCITEGVVSRLEHRTYSHSGAYLLSGQIDAPINPGSSGGPVIKGSKLVGISFQSFEGENIGYMIPTPIINHFLKDIEDGKYDGFPALGIMRQDTENPDLREKYKMSDKLTGVLVTRVYPLSPAKGILEPDDVILSIDGRKIQDDGTVSFRNDERIDNSFIYQEKFINDTIQAEILRNGEIKNVEIKLTIPSDACFLVPGDQYDSAPTYYILGGIVFEPLTMNFLKSWESPSDAPPNLVYYLFEGEQAEERREIVLLVQVLADNVNVGYQDIRYSIITKANGVNAATFDEFVQAIENNQSEYHVLEDERGSRIILNKEKAKESLPRILENYKIPSDRSKNLMK